MIVTIGTIGRGLPAGRSVVVDSVDDVDNLIGPIDCIVFSKQYVSSSVHVESSGEHKPEGVSNLLKDYLKARSYTTNVYSYPTDIAAVDTSYLDLIQGHWFDPESFDKNILDIVDNQDQDVFVGAASLLNIILSNSLELDSAPVGVQAEKSEPFTEEDVTIRAADSKVYYNPTSVSEGNYTAIHFKEMGPVPRFTSFMLGYHEFYKNKYSRRVRMVLILPNNDITKAKYLPFYRAVSNRAAWVEPSSRTNHVPDSADLVFLFSPVESVIKKLFLNSFYSKYIIVDRIHDTERMHIDVKGRASKHVYVFSSLLEASKMRDSSELNLNRVNRGVLVADSASDSPNINGDNGYLGTLEGVDPDWPRMPYLRNYPSPYQSRKLAHGMEIFKEVYKNKAVSL